MKRIGTRLQVMNGLAKQTGVGLKKKDLKYNKIGKIVSKKLSAMAIQNGGVQTGGGYPISIYELRKICNKVNPAELYYDTIGNVAVGETYIDMNNVDQQIHSVYRFLGKLKEKIDELNSPSHRNYPYDSITVGKEWIMISINQLTNKNYV